ncbi:metal-dependent transcriptional regulator [Candidatus Viridilinea mediisalina]|uniref:Manganese transport regulator n=1 Tax=Candidatus Viridilinea mediisalina TaxID=2024553 RepID=A0A2A6RLM9_9CHLR|nr:metal-dependent transcriptional regulator [Candidatus Viridilinea mediisalina]PDW03835.1 DNA-binding protein [Candidatus Viridilinea mediisalina]
MAELQVLKGTHPRQRRRAGGDGPTNKERDYLEIIYYLVQRDEPVIAAHVARWLSLQPPTVSHALQEMEKKAYIQRDERGEIALTAQGLELAEVIIRRHRLLERFLADIVGLPWYALHEEAVLLEHALSPLLEERITQLLGDATTCPHGNPIPGSGAHYTGGTRLDRAEAGTLFTIRRIEEEAEERTEFLRYLEAQRLLPGNQFFIPDASPDYGITLRSCNRDMTVSPEIAAVIWGDCAPIDTVAPEGV